MAIFARLCLPWVGQLVGLTTDGQLKRFPVRGAAILAQHNATRVIEARDTSFSSINACDSISTLYCPVYAHPALFKPASETIYLRSAGSLQHLNTTSASCVTIHQVLCANDSA